MFFSDLSDPSHECKGCGKIGKGQATVERAIDHVPAVWGWAGGVTHPRERRSVQWCVTRHAAGVAQLQLGAITHAPCCHIGGQRCANLTARVESAPTWRVGWARQLALQDDALAHSLDCWVWNRHSREQRLRIRVLWPREHLVDWARLHDAAQVHDRDVIGHMLHHGEVV